MELLKLTLKNFKGIKKFEFSPGGNNAEIYADNGVGKTTLSDAYAWLLTDKNSQDDAGFEIKTLDSSNETIHNLEHEVEGTFNVEGKALPLKKTYRETYSGKGIKKVFDGHEIIREIDGLAVSKQVFQAKLDELAPKGIFKSLLNPSYFSAQKMETKRGILLDMIGNISLEVVIASVPELTTLPDIIGNHTPEDYKAISKKQQTKLKEQKKAIPERIDEVLLDMPEVEDLDENNLQIAVASLKDNKATAEKELLQIEHSGNIAKLEEKLAKIRAAKLTAETEEAKISLKKRMELISQQAVCEREIKGLQEDISKLISGIEADNKVMLDHGERLIALRQGWKEIKDEQYTTPPETCPECGQNIPEDQYEESLKKGTEKFNLWKAKTLAKINTKGREIVEEKKEVEARIVQSQKDIEIKKLSGQGQEKALAAINEKLESLSKEAFTSPEWEVLKKEEGICIREIQDAETGNIAGQKEKLLSSIATIAKDISDVSDILMQFDIVEGKEARVTALRKKQKQLTKEYETLEKNIALIDLYVTTRVKMIEGPLNDLFEITTWKMFETQVNGGVKDVCIAMYDGIPYEKNLNKGHRKMIGIDIIKTLSNEFGVSIPLFVDDCEGVTELPKIDAQVIKLIKPEITKENKKYYSKLQTIKFEEA